MYDIHDWSTESLEKTDIQEHYMKEGQGCPGSKRGLKAA